MCNGIAHIACGGVKELGIVHIVWQVEIRNMDMMD